MLGETLAKGVEMGGLGSGRKKTTKKQATRKKATKKKATKKRVSKAAPAVKNKGGAPSTIDERLTPELMQDIADAVRAGNYLETAAMMHGVRGGTARQWLFRGHEENSGTYAKFRNIVKKADAEFEASRIDRIRKDGSWQSDAWLAERKYPERWAKREPPEEKADTGPSTLSELAKTLNLHNLTAAELGTLMQLMTKAERGDDGEG